MVGVQKNAMESSRLRMSTGQTEKLSLTVTTNAKHIQPHQKCLHHRQGKGGKGNQGCWPQGRQRHWRLTLGSGKHPHFLEPQLSQLQNGDNSPGLLSLTKGVLRF